VTAAQVREVVGRLRTAGQFRDGDPDILLVSDSGYDVATSSDTSRYGTAHIATWDRLHPKLSHRGPWADYERPPPIKVKLSGHINNKERASPCESSSSIRRPNTAPSRNAVELPGSTGRKQSSVDREAG
jgi:hypothetical protein